MATVGVLLGATGTAAAAVGTAAVVGGTLGIASIVEGRKARKQQEAAQRAQQKSQRLKAGRQAVEQIRQAQIARAQIIAQGEAAGVGDSSAVIGGAGSVQSQAGSNIAFLQQLSNLQAEANARIQSAQRASFRAGAFGSFAGTIANTDFGSIFGNSSSISTGTSPGITNITGVG